MKLAAILSAGRCQESINPRRIGMEHPVVYVACVAKFLDQLIQEHGVYLFVGFVFLCLLLIAWMIVRRRQRPVQQVPVVHCSHMKPYP
jgi:hypothetical protein